MSVIPSRRHYSALAHVPPDGIQIGGAHTRHGALQVASPQCLECPVADDGSLLPPSYRHLAKCASQVCKVCFVLPDSCNPLTISTADMKSPVLTQQEILMCRKAFNSFDNDGQDEY